MADGDEDGAAEMMGTRAPWLAFTGLRDDAIHASHWFVRSAPTPVVAFSRASFEEFKLLPGEEFAYRYRVVVADGAWDRDRAEGRLGSHPW